MASTTARARPHPSERKERERQRLDRIGVALERVRAACDVTARVAADPVGVVHRYPAPLDRELMGLVAALVAFGNVKTIRAKLEDAAARIATVADTPTAAADDERALHHALRTWKHRVFRGEDIARLLIGARRVQVAHGSLGAFFARALEARGGSVRESLADLCDAIRSEGRLVSKTRRGPAHLLPDPRRSSGSKRLFLYLRWMIRPADGVDFGVWDLRPVDPSILLCPVDVHIHKLARNLGFTRRKDMSWTTTEEITRALARYDARDPVKYDFALCHLGMLQRCPSRRDAARCEGCAIMDVCRHWT